MAFREIATAITILGGKVIPLLPNSKQPNTLLVPNGAKDASADALQIAIWNSASPDANVGWVATPGTQFFIDEDQAGAVPAQLFKDAYRAETWSGKVHIILQQTEETRDWGNHSEQILTDEMDEHGRRKRRELFSIRCDCQYITGVGSVIDGKAYKYHSGTLRPPTEDEMVWLRKYVVKSTPARIGESHRNLHKDFTPEKFFAYYRLQFKKDGGKYHVHFPDQGCPVAGRIHHNDSSTKPREIEQSTFTFDDGVPGFCCLSGGCYGKGFKDAHSELIRRTGKKPFPVWEPLEEKDEICIEWGYESKRTELEFLWPGVLPLGKLVHFGGNSAQGKSPLMVDIAARVTTGRDFPDGSKNSWGPRSVLIANMEDDWNDTIMPRFDRARGDDQKFARIKHRQWTKGEKTYQRLLRLDEDMRLLREKASRIPDLALIIIDPITNYLGAAKMNNEADVRSLVLMPLADLAQDLHVVINTVGHFNRRDKGTDPLHRLMGAAAFGGVSRAIYLCGQDPDSEDKYDHVMTVGRSCSGDDQFSGLKYKTTWDGKAVGVEWGGKSSADAVDVVDPATGNEKGKLAEAAECLRGIVAGHKDGAPARTCINQMANAGFDLTRMDAYAVRRRASVKSRKDGKLWTWFIEGETV